MMKKRCIPFLIVLITSSSQFTTRLDAFVLPSSFENTAKTSSVRRGRHGERTFQAFRSFDQYLQTGISGSCGLGAISSQEFENSIHPATTSHRLFSRRLKLYSKKDDRDPLEEEKSDDDTSMSVPIAQKFIVLWKLFYTKFMNFVPTLRLAVASFTVGAIFALTVIFVPVYNSVDKMSEPVTLFETILTVRGIVIVSCMFLLVLLLSLVVVL